MNTNTNSPEAGGSQGRAARPRTKSTLLWGGLTLGTIGIVAIGAIVMQAHLKAAAQPTISWSPASDLEFLQPNQTRTATVTFTSNQAINDVIVFVTPALTPVITVAPPSFSNVAANQPYQLTLTLKAGATPELKFDGTIQLKQPGVPSNATFARPLAATVVVHNKYVPPDPGAANDHTIAGVDSDNDGVRDDVERYVIEKYVTTPQLVQPLLQYARASQAFILDLNDKQAALRLDEQRDRPVQCVVSIVGYEGFAIRDDVRAAELNTPARRQAYDDVDRLLSGTSFFPPPIARWSESCS